MKTKSEFAPSFRPFEKNDLMTFAGVESENPHIAFTGNFALILDGEVFQVHSNSGNSFSLPFNESPKSPRLTALIAEAVFAFLSPFEVSEEGMETAENELVNEFGFELL